VSSDRRQELDEIRSAKDQLAALYSQLASVVAANKSHAHAAHAAHASTSQQQPPPDQCEPPASTWPPDPDCRDI